MKACSRTLTCASCVCMELVAACCRNEALVFSSRAINDSMLPASFLLAGLPTVAFLRLIPLMATTAADTAAAATMAESQPA